MTRRWTRTPLLIACAAVVVLALALQGTTFLSRAAPDRGSPRTQQSHVDDGRLGEEEGGAHSPDASPLPAATVTVVVTDLEGGPVAGVDAAADSVRREEMTSGHQTDETGRVTMPLPEERGPRGWWISARKVGYFGTTTVLPFEAARTEYYLSLRLKREPQLRVFDAGGRPISNYSLVSIDGRPVGETRGLQSLAHAIIDAEGYLSVPVRALPLLSRPEIMNAYAEGPSEKHADVYLVGTAGLPELRVEIKGAPTGSEALARIEVVNEEPSVPPRSPVADSPDLARLGGDWRDFYAQGEGPLSEPPGQIVFVDTTRGSSDQWFRVGEGLRIIARGKVTVICWVVDHTPAAGSTTIRSGEHQTLLLECTRAAWPRYEFDLVDRYGRMPDGPVRAYVSGRPIGNMSLGANRVAVPPEFEPSGWRIDFMAGSVGSTALVLRPEDDLQGVGRVEFDAIDLVLRFVDQETGKELSGQDIQARIGVTTGHFEEGAFRFRLISPACGLVEIQSRMPGGGPVFGPVRRLPLVLPAHSEGPVVQQVIRVRPS